MLFGIDKRRIGYVLLFILIGINQACSQTKEEKMKLAKQHNEKAIELRFQDNVKGAIQEQLKAIKLDPQNAELWVDIVGLYIDDNNLEKAKNAAEQSLKLDNKNAWANYIYGGILEELGEEKKGIEYKKIATELDQNNPIFLTNYGVALENDGNIAEAKKMYESALMKDSNFIFALVRLGLLENDLGNKQRAIELLEKATKMKPTDKEDNIFKKAASDKLAEIKTKDTKN